RGTALDWKGFDRGRPRSKVELPTYPFERTRCWFEDDETQSRSRKASAKPQEWKEWLYDLQWKPLTEASTSNELFPANSRWLILADNTGVGKQLAEQMTANGHRVELIDRPSSVQALQDAVRLSEECQGIVHLWSLDAGEGAAMSLPSLESAQSLTCESLLNVLQALLG